MLFVCCIYCLFVWGEFVYRNFRGLPRSHWAGLERFFVCFVAFIDCLFVLWFGWFDNDNNGERMYHHFRGLPQSHWAGLKSLFVCCIYLLFFLLCIMACIMNVPSFPWTASVTLSRSPILSSAMCSPSNKQCKTIKISTDHKTSLHPLWENERVSNILIFGSHKHGQWQRICKFWFQPRKKVGRIQVCLKFLDVMASPVSQLLVSDLTITKMSKWMLIIKCD